MLNTTACAPIPQPSREGFIPFPDPLGSAMGWLFIVVEDDGESWGVVDAGDWIAADGKVKRHDELFEDADDLNEYLADHQDALLALAGSVLTEAEVYTRIGCPRVCDAESVASRQHNLKQLPAEVHL